jgi:hypothetical protein
MSEMSNEAIQATINARGLKVGNVVKAQTTEAAVSGSQQLYVDANGSIATGAIPFALVTSAASTSVSVMDVTGYATLSADEIMHGTLVAGAGVTTFTKTGFLQINVTDSAGNITNGKHYIQFGTLT